MKRTFSRIFTFMFVSTLGFVNTFSSQGAVTKGKWELSGDTWKFYNEKNEVHKGWVETSSGWYYLDPESGEMKTGWQNINGVEYYFDSAKDGVSGHMHTGWYKSPEGKWYFFNPDQTTGGGMLTGWQWIDGYCYYFDPTPGKESGGMVAGKTTPDGFKINENGQWTDDSGKVQYVAGKGFSSNTSSGSTNTVTDTAKNKEKTASRKGKSSGHSGGGGSSGRSGQSSKPSESEKPKAPQSQEESRPSESEKPKAPQSQKESRPSESEKPKAPEKQEESRPSESKEPKAPEKQEESRPSESEKPKESQSQEESRPSESKSPKAPQSREESGPSESEKPKAPEKQEESRPSESKEPKAPQSREESKPSESKKPKESESQEESRPSESEKETEQNNAALTDGEWYGTATWSRYKLQRGSNVVKVTIKNGKIEKVDSVVYTDDGKIAGSYERKRDYLLEKFKGLEDTKGIKKQLDEGRGEVYDAVSGATETARGHLSAVDNALERSKKFKKDHKEQKIEYIEFAKRPDSVATGQTLDLSKTVLKLHLKGGEVKEITPLEFADYGIVTDPLHGSTLPSLLEFVHVHFKNADSLIDIQSEIQVRKKLGKKYPDKIKISYENGETKDIALNKDEYRYTVEAKGKIKEMSIYSGEEELGKAKYDRDLSQWRFNMKDIPHPGYDEWGYDIYAVIIDVSKDTSDIASFNLETKLIKKNYYVGDSLEIGDLEINAVTKNGNNKAFVGWEACKAGRFTSNPDNGYVFTNDDIGEKTIHISKTIDNVSVEKTFTVNVSDPKKQAPAKLEIYAGEKKITTVNVDFNKFREAQGYLKIFNVEIPKEYENWNKDTFSVKAYNDEGTLLESKVGKKYSVLTVDFKNYRAFHESGGYVWIGFKFVETAASQSEYVDGEWYGTATWSRYKLQRGSNVVKVTIKNGKIEKVDSVVYTDDGKIAGSYERKRDYLLEKFKGLEDTKGIKKQLDEGRGEVYDAVSGATETARGHLSAVDNALERSKKFKKDHKEQKIEYIEFAKRPDSVATGQTLDLSKTVLKLHLKGGEVKEITPLEFADYGIVTDPLHGSTLPSLLEFVHVHFKNADSLIDIQSEIQVRKKLGKKYPDKIKISYENGETKDIALNKDEYRYTVEAKGKIKEMSIYSGEEELGKAKYDRDLSQWRFNMKDIPHPGYDEWGYDIYAVIIDVSKDTSDIASFNLETKLIKKNYYVGDSLEIGDLEINAVTKNGNNKAFVGWEACKAGRFTSNPDNGYVFTNDDIGEKTIHISKTIDNVSVEKTFTVNVSDPKKQAPAKLEIYAGEKKITTVNVDFNKFREAQGYLKIFNVEIPKEYENWNKDTFSVKAYNDEGTLLESKVGKKYTVLTVDFKNYRAFHESGGYVWIGFKFVETAKPEQVLPVTVELYDKQELIYKKTGITKQEFESSNAHLMLDVTIPKKYENKWDKDTFTVKVLDSKGTQLSHSLTKSDNILNIALSDYHSPQFGNGSIGLKFKYEGGESETGDIKTARGEAQMETFFYKAKVLVTYNEKTGKIIKVQDDGTEPGNANNRNYWNMSVEMFEKLVGKTKDSVDTVDAVTGATLSSNAIKNAVKAALPKEAVPDATNMDVLNLVVDGNKHTYYYKKYDPTNTNMTFMVKGKDVTDKTKLVRNPYVPKVYYYVEDDQKLTGDLYGTADFPYSYFYFGELMRGRITPPSKSNDPQIGQEPVMVQSMSFDGKYTDVSSSTAKNYGKFATAVYSDKKKNSYKIRGVKTPVQIDAELYAKVKLLAAVGAENHSALIPAVTSMTAPDSITGVKREVTQNELPTYKVIHTDSSISELKSSDNASEIAYNPSDIKVSLTDQSEYGDYQIHIEGLPDEIKVDKNVLGVTFEAGASSNSARIYGLSQLDNILPNGDLGFSVNMRQKGGRLAHKRFEILSGSRIYKITYLLNNYKKFEIDGLELYIPKKLGANAVPSISSQTGFDDENGAKVIFDMSKLPYTGYKVSELYFGTKESGKKLEEGSDYSFEESSNTLTINSTDSTQKGKYTVVFEDNNKTDGYVSTSFTFDVGEASGSGDDSNIVKEVEEEITRFGYYAALRVTINKKTGTVVSVEDNDTNAGANRGFWANALNMLPRFVGKKASEIDTVDGISGATVSSDAIKKAVKKAFAEQSGFRMANRDMSMQPRLATDSNAKKPLERKNVDGENNREDLTIPSYHTERKVIMKNKVGELYDSKKLIF